MTVMAAEDRPTRTHLSDLVRDRRAGLRLSLERLAERCVDPDPDDPEDATRLKRSWLHRLELAENVIPPQIPQLRALAAGLNLPLQEVQDAAAAQFFGIDAVWSPSGKVRALVDDAEHLTPDQIEQLRRFIASFTPNSAG